MITFDEEMNSLPPERRAKIEAKTQELLQEMQLIQEIREQLGFLPEQIPEELQKLANSKEDNLAQILNLKKIQNYIHIIRS